jgi:hypothetical protein
MVLMEFEVSAETAESTASEFSALLAKKYGAPSKNEDSFGPESQWSTPGARITLQRISPIRADETHKQDYGLVSITYESKLALDNYENRELKKL